MNLKQVAGERAVDFVEDGMVVGLGTGSTAYFAIRKIAERVREGFNIRGVITSERTRELATEWNIPLVDIDEVERVDLTIDGADEVDPYGNGIKGGGGALTREKICAQVAATFVCIADVSKQVERLGSHPLPVEVVPMATRLVEEHLRGLGGRPVLRDGFTTDNGGCILDTRGLDLSSPETLEADIDAHPGVIASGLFARRRADIALIAAEDGVREVTARPTPPL
jgi:ribose 5-phosphate isomerase A